MTYDYSADTVAAASSRPEITNPHSPHFMFWEGVDVANNVLPAGLDQVLTPARNISVITDNAILPALNSAWFLFILGPLVGVVYIGVWYQQKRSREMLFDTSYIIKKFQQIPGQDGFDHDALAAQILLFLPAANGGLVSNYDSPTDENGSDGATATGESVAMPLLQDGSITQQHTPTFNQSWFERFIKWCRDTSIQKVLSPLWTMLNAYSAVYWIFWFIYVIKEVGVKFGDFAPTIYPSWLFWGPAIFLVAGSLIAAGILYLLRKNTTWTWDLSKVSERIGSEKGKQHEVDIIDLRVATQKAHLLHLATDFKARLLKEINNPEIKKMVDSIWDKYDPKKSAVQSDAKTSTDISAKLPVVLVAARDRINDSRRYKFLDYFAAPISGFVSGFTGVIFALWPVTDFLGFMLPVLATGMGAAILFVATIGLAVLIGIYFAAKSFYEARDQRREDAAKFKSIAALNSGDVEENIVSLQQQLSGLDKNASLDLADNIPDAGNERYFRNLDPQESGAGTVIKKIGIRAMVFAGKLFTGAFIVRMLIAGGGFVPSLLVILGIGSGASIVGLPVFVAIAIAVTVIFAIFKLVEYHYTRARERDRTCLYEHESREYALEMKQACLEMRCAVCDQKEESMVPNGPPPQPVEELGSIITMNEKDTLASSIEINPEPELRE